MEASRQFTKVLLFLLQEDIRVGRMSTGLVRVDKPYARGNKPVICATRLHSTSTCSRACTYADRHAVWQSESSHWEMAQQAQQVPQCLSISHGSGLQSASELPTRSDSAQEPILRPGRPCGSAETFRVCRLPWC